MNVLGISIREVDILLAPLMIFLYLASGVLVKDGVKNLLLNPGFDTWWANRSKESAEKRAAQKEIAEEIAKQREDARLKAEEAKLKQMEEFQKGNKKQKDLADEKRAQSALNGNYSNALAKYREKEEEIKEKYQAISSNIEFIRDIDKQEMDFEEKVIPSLMRIIDASILSTKSNVALRIRQKTGEDIEKLRTAIEVQNTKHHEHNR